MVSRDIVALHCKGCITAFLRIGVVVGGVESEEPAFKGRFIFAQGWPWVKGYVHSSSSSSKATSVKAAVYYVYVRRPIPLPTYYSEATALSSAPPFFALDKGQGFAAKQGYKYIKLQIFIEKGKQYVK